MFFTFILINREVELKMKNKFIKIKAVGIVIALVLMAIILVVPSASAVHISKTKTYKSDTTDLWWSGSTSSEINGAGYIVPPGSATWSNAKFCWSTKSTFT